MADLAVAAVLGPAHRNSDRPRYADVVAHLYVGGAGLWQFDLATEVASAVNLLERRMGHRWSNEELKLDVMTLRELARQVADLDVAVLVTLLAPDRGVQDEFVQMPWSVVVAASIADSRSTQWD